MNALEAVRMMSKQMRELGCTVEQALSNVKLSRQLNRTPLKGETAMINFHEKLEEDKLTEGGRVTLFVYGILRPDSRNAMVHYDPEYVNFGRAYIHGTMYLPGSIAHVKLDSDSRKVLGYVLEISSAVLPRLDMLEGAYTRTPVNAYLEDGSPIECQVYVSNHQVREGDYKFIVEDGDYVRALEAQESSFRYYTAETDTDSAEDSYEPEEEEDEFEEENEPETDWTGERVYGINENLSQAMSSLAVACTYYESLCDSDLDDKAMLEAIAGYCAAADAFALLEKSFEAAKNLRRLCSDFLPCNQCGERAIWLETLDSGQRVNWCDSCIPEDKLPRND